MSEQWLWIDFGDIAADGTTQTLPDYAPAGMLLRPGVSVPLGDAEGNRGTGMILSLTRGPRGALINLRVHEIRMAEVAP